MKNWQRRRERISVAARRILERQRSGRRVIADSQAGPRTRASAVRQSALAPDFADTLARRLGASGSRSEAGCFTSGRSIWTSETTCPEARRYPSSAGPHLRYISAWSPPTTKSDAPQIAGSACPVGPPAAEVGYLVAHCPILARHTGRATLLGRMRLLWPRPRPGRPMGSDSSRSGPTIPHRLGAAGHPRRLP
jgi:hypothetical protein